MNRRQALATTAILFLLKHPSVHRRIEHAIRPSTRVIGFTTTPPRQLRPLERRLRTTVADAIQVLGRRL